jgi:hypothetical protein
MQQLQHRDTSDQEDPQPTDGRTPILYHHVSHQLNNRKSTQPLKKIEKFKK